MKIAIISRGFSSHHGGAERFTISFIKKIINLGHEVHLFSGEDFKDFPLKIKITRINYIKSMSLLKILSFHFNVKKELEKGNFDIIYGLCQFFPLDFFYAGGGVYLHWMKLRYSNPIIRFLKYITSPVHLGMLYLEKNIFNKNNIIISNSNLVKNHILKYYNIPSNQIKVIYDGVDHSKFNVSVKKHNIEVREKYNLKIDDIVILYVSNNWKRKGLFTILKSLKNFPENVKLVVAGKGNIKKYQNICKFLKIDLKRIVFTNVLKNIEPIYGAGDIFILPTQYDPFSQVCKEALACGLPVITTKSNGASEIIDINENGFILDDYKDHQLLTIYIKKLLNKEIREKFSKNALIKVKDFSWEKNAKEHMNVFFKKN